MRSGRKYPSNYIKASLEDKVISTPEELSEVIHENGLIAATLDRVNDKDRFWWDLNTPEKYAAACWALFKKSLGKQLYELGYTVNGFVLDLLSEDIYDEFFARVATGDFDNLATDSDVDPEEWVEDNFSDDTTSHRSVPLDARRQMEEELAALDAKYPPRERGNAAYTEEYTAIRRKYGLRF